MFLSKQQYILDVIARSSMTDCKPCTTPVDTSDKVSDDGALVSDATDCQAFVGALQYLTFTRLDIAHAI